MFGMLDYRAHKLYILVSSLIGGAVYISCMYLVAVNIVAIKNFNIFALLTLPLWSSAICVCGLLYFHRIWSEVFSFFIDVMPSVTDRTKEQAWAVAYFGEFAQRIISLRHLIGSDVVQIDDADFLGYSAMQLGELEDIYRYVHFRSSYYNYPNLRRIQEIAGSFVRVKNAYFNEDAQYVGWAFKLILVGKKFSLNRKEQIDYLTDCAISEQREKNDGISVKIPKFGEKSEKDIKKHIKKLFPLTNVYIRRSYYPLLKITAFLLLVYVSIDLYLFKGTLLLLK